MAAIRALGVRGMNVSMPYKTAVMEHLDAIDESALVIGAVNTINNIDGVLTGYRASHASLAEQALATQELLDAAKSASAKKATGAVAKAQAKTTPAPAAAKPASARSGDDDDEGGGPDDEGGGGSAGGAAAAPVAPAPAPAEDDREPQLFG